MSARAGKQTIALLGLRCSGKTTVGGLLATALGLPFLDLDEELLRSGRHAGWHVAGVGELLERAGQAVFRDLEASVLRRALESEPRLVLATGGGVVERPDNRTWLERAARCVFLSVPLATLAARLRADPTPRPALLGQDAAAELAALAERREAHYRSLAAVVIECGVSPPAEIVQRIRSALAQSH